MQVGRFAPSTTGPAHPGTLLAALLCWLDARSRAGRVLLRLEDLDPDRSSPDLRHAMREALDWLGLDWDGEAEQSAHRIQHEAALDRLAAAGVLYPCSCTRADIRAAGVRAPDGGFRYGGRCRGQRLPPASAGGWRASVEPLRVRLSGGRLELNDESGLDLSQDPAATFGDPVVRRRDGSFAYHLATVVDDSNAGVTRVVRGRDLAASTATQVALQRQLDLSTPVYRHHFLLLEERGGKLAKLHGAVGVDELRRAFDAPTLCGILAHWAGLAPSPAPTTPRDLLTGFDWARVRSRDLAVRWTPPERLEPASVAGGGPRS